MTSQTDKLSALVMEHVESLRFGDKIKINRVRHGEKAGEWSIHWFGPIGGWQWDFQKECIIRTTNTGDSDTLIKSSTADLADAIRAAQLLEAEAAKHPQPMWLENGETVRSPLYPE